MGKIAKPCTVTEVVKA
ncbi:hypothetical protein AYI68_g6457, partial [Smittium mucronatum]